MCHYILLDEIEQLVIEKDSSLLLAHMLKECGKEVKLIFIQDLYFLTKYDFSLRAFSFESSLCNKSHFKVQSFTKRDEERVRIKKNDTIHMRMEPPVDMKYIRVLWLLQYFESIGTKVVNSPRGILQINEKVDAYCRQEDSIESYVGGDEFSFLKFTNTLKEKGKSSVIVKPLDQFQGIGVEKWDILNSGTDELKQKFLNKVRSNHGVIVAQPFVEEIYQGEVRSVFFKGKEIGSILKKPPQDSFLANIAQGATYKSYVLTQLERKRCEKVCEEFKSIGVDWIAFDLLNSSLSEINITCPGLIVEVSVAYGVNKMSEIIELME